MARVLFKGNEVIAEAALRAGVEAFFGYPITPQNEVPEYLAREMPKRGGVFLQTESELAGINMVLGASAAGARVMTSSSGPGLCLMLEAISSMALTRLPAVIVDVVRSGPGMGDLAPAQEDWKLSGNGAYKIPILLPGNVQELANMVFEAFDIADQYSTPVLVLADGMLGQMMEPVEFKDQGENAKIDKPWALTGHQFKRPHNVVNSLYLKPADLERLVKERFERYETIKKTEQRAEEYLVDDADIVVVAYGASSRVARSAVNAARAEGIKAGLIRPITLWPFPTDALQRAAQHVKKFLAVEMSMGQMVDDVRLAIHDQKPVEFYGRTGGMIPTPAEVLGAVKKAGGVL